MFCGMKTIPVQSNTTKKRKDSKEEKKGKVTSQGQLVMGSCRAVLLQLMVEDVKNREYRVIIVPKSNILRSGPSNVILKECSWAVQSVVEVKLRDIGIDVRVYGTIEELVNYQLSVRHSLGNSLAHCGPTLSGLSGLRAYVENVLKWVATYCPSLRLKPFRLDVVVCEKSTGGQGDIILNELQTDIDSRMFSEFTKARDVSVWWAERYLYSILEFSGDLNKL